MHDDFININMVTSSVGALDCCHIWNHLFLTCCFNFATFLCIWRLDTTFLWFIAWRIHCKAVETWLSRDVSCWKHCEGLWFCPMCPFHPFIFLAVSEFLCRVFQVLEQVTSKYPHHKDDHSSCSLIFPCLFVYILRKPASWIVAVCERSEYKGVWGQSLPLGAQNLAITWGEGCVFWAFFRVMYHAAKGWR